MRSRTVHGAGVDDPLAWYSGGAMDTTTLRFLHADRQGSIALLGDAAGNAVRIWAYDEWGTPMASGGIGDGAGGLLPDNGARHLYTGQAWMPGMGLYYYKARMYSPTLGRFLQTDPIGYDDQMNLYAYVGGDPMNRSDPTGMKSKLKTTHTGSIIPGVVPAFLSCTGECSDDSSGLGSVDLAAEESEETDEDVSGAIIGATPQSVDDIVVTARKTGRLAGVRINFNLRYPLEQLWVVTSDGQVIYVLTVAEMYQDSCGNTLGKNSPAGAVPGDVSALIHTHPDWGYGWPAAGDYTSAQRYDVYNINRGGTWVLRQGAARGSAPTTLSGRAPSVPPSGGGAGCR